MVSAITKTARLAPSAPVSALKGVAGRLTERLAQLDIHTIQDLLFHLPSRYQNRSHRVAIGALRPGDEATVRGEVLLVQPLGGKRRALGVRIGDGTGSLQLRFFNVQPRRQEMFARGALLSCYGEVRAAAAGVLEMLHPECSVLPTFAGLGAGSDDADEQTLTPVYPTTAGLHQTTLRSIIARSLTLLEREDFLPELIDAALLAARDLPSLRAALLLLHRPPLEVIRDAGLGTLAIDDAHHPARQRLAFEELIAHQISLRTLHAKSHQHRAPVLCSEGELQQRFRDSLPFALTHAQRRVIAEISGDLCQPFPMQRLLQGDVGSGKTAVAAAAVLCAVEAGYQAAVMAPTELLAEQHHRTLGQWLAPLGIEMRWLSGATRSRERALALADLAAGAAQVAIGTHALFQEDVEFAALGLLVIDEQHRFGVHQRLALREKGRSGVRYPHQLIMTATPIPRTLMMTAYADLDCSVIDELPPGRQPVTTVVLPDARRGDVLERVREACAQGRQAYWVCTLIDESEVLQCQAASETAQLLVEMLPDLSVGLLHGRLKAAEKEAIMAAFKRGDMDLLVATTVIEVGVDVPNASLMIIENAERLGLAQLHQLRGRVGRGSEKSACVLMYHSPLSERGRARLAVLRETSDGFEIAKRDLELRGPGEILGVRQAGQMRLRAADLLRDQDLIPVAATIAQEMLECDPPRAAALVRRWLEDGQRYSAV